MLLFATRCRRHGLSDNIRQLQRRFNRLLFPRALDSRCNLRRIPLLAVFPENAANLIAIPFVDNLICRQLLLLIHAHVQLGVMHIRKAALCDVQLRRRYTQIKQDAIYLLHAARSNRRVNVPEVTFYQRHTVAHLCQAFFRVGECHIIAVNGNQAAALGQTLCNVQRVSRSAQRRVYVHAIRTNVQAVETLGQQN